SKWVGEGNIFAVPIAVLIGVPLYANAAGVIPIVKELTRLGVQTGTALAFMMAVTALSLPEFIILKKVLKLRLLITYFAIIATGIILVGYLFNIIMK
ncbi:MAG TPA: permease, partial [bacterium]|nr:permease [bacterium]